MTSEELNKLIQACGWAGTFVNTGNYNGVGVAAGISSALLNKALSDVSPEELRNLLLTEEENEKENQT